MTHARTLALGLMLAVALGAASLDAGVKITVKQDKTFNFEGLRTYAWRLDGAEPVKMLQNTVDDPVQIRKDIEPLILKAVDEALAKKGFTRVASDPQLFLDYYLLVGPGVNSQYQGQFIGAVPAWGLPDFAMSTTSLTIYEQGSLILDVVSPKEKAVVWRGAADAKIDRNRTDAQRASLITDAANKMLAKFPPKFQK
jgi:hypothetical protein